MWPSQNGKASEIPGSGCIIRHVSQAEDMNEQTYERHDKEKQTSRAINEKPET